MNAAVITSTVNRYQITEIIVTALHFFEKRFTGFVRMQLRLHRVVGSSPTLLRQVAQSVEQKS